MYKKLLFGFVLFIGQSLCPSDNLNKDVMKTNEFSFLVKSRPTGDLGVCAAHDIAQGTELFHEPFEVRIMKSKDIPDEFKTYCIPINEEELACPERFDRMEIGWYMNVSSTHANIEKRIGHTYDNTVELLAANTFYAIKDIKAGKEILIDVEPVREHFSKK